MPIHHLELGRALNRKRIPQCPSNTAWCNQAKSLRRLHGSRGKIWNLGWPEWQSRRRSLDTMHHQDHLQLGRRLRERRESFQLGHLRARQGMLARLGLELHQSRWLRGIAGRPTSMADTRPLQELKETVHVADLVLNNVDELPWAWVDRLVLEKKAG